MCYFIWKGHKRWTFLILCYKVHIYPCFERNTDAFNKVFKKNSWKFEKSFSKLLKIHLYTRLSTFLANMNYGYNIFQKLIILVDMAINNPRS